MSGSGGGGGYQYQAQATAYIATHILAKQPLHWIEHSEHDVPIAVAAETEGPGDDIRITLQNDLVIELQAKHGLKKNTKFWEALVRLIHGLAENSSLYGVLLTDSTASSTIRDDLREDIIRLGQGREDNLKTITKEVIDRLNGKGILCDSEILKRFRIVIVDLDDSIRNAKVALEVLSKVLQNPEQEGQAWSVLCNDGLDLIKKRGQRNAESLLRLLGRNNIQLAPAANLKQPIEWQQICRSMLPIELDANPLISGDRVTLGIEDIVPLDLVERKERPKPTRDPSPENLHQALEDQEIPLPYNCFFKQVLIACKSRNEQGKGIAIIGDPGAGKTTLLCAIAHWIMQRNELPIFVSLQDLETDLETYLLETWLRKAISKRKAPNQLQDNLVEQCNAGRVWLLLDGVDEMAEPNRSLSTLAKEFKGWVDNARIVLTCRVNVWEANRNALRSKVEVYRSRGFRDEEQCIFIQNFFVKANQVETGIRLVEKLEQAPPRLKDLIRNPLLLTLLCRTWKRQEGKLPATKAELYEGFIRTFYDWKDQPSIPEETRPILERALGEIAKKSIDQEDFRFRLRETFIRQELDKFDPAFFSIACELGWINKLGSAVENPDELVYAFLHPTFQEYFAALAIDDWDDFLPLNHVDKPTSNRKGECKYRIFEPQWKEVILFWLGRSDIEKDEKEALVDRLMQFDDGGGEIYKYRAYFLAAAGIAEFECLQSNVIITRLIRQGFRHFDQERKGWVRECRRPLEQGARHALLETDRKRASLALVQFIQKKPSDVFSRRDALNVLGQIGFRHPTVIKFLEQLIFDETQHESIYWQAIQSLGHVDPENANITRRPKHIVAKEKEEEEEMFRSFAQDYTIAISLEGKLIAEVPHSHLSHWLSLEGLKDTPVEVSDLKKGLSSSGNNLKVFLACYKALWHCAQKISYSDFHQA